VHDVTRHEGDNGSKNLVAKEQTHLDETAAARKVNTPLFLGVVLVIDLDVTDAVEEELDEEILVG